MIFCYQNCSSYPDNLLKSEAEGREIANFLRSLEQYFQTVKGQTYFLTCSWRFLIIYKAEQ